MMKRLIHILLCLSLSAFQLQAEDHLRERVYLSTDRTVYVAGDAIWCSAYCLDVNTGRLSSFSEIAYVELHSSDGMAQTAKISLKNGRGAGCLEIPNTVPTGNYRLIAYTAQSCNEKGYDYLPGSRTVSVFNTFSGARVKSGVELVDAAAYEDFCKESAPGDSSGIELVPEGRDAILIKNNSGADVSLNLSVFHNDGIVAPYNEGIASFVRRVKALPPAEGFSMERIPEYEGEIVRARVVGANADLIAGTAGMHAFLSTPGLVPNPYSARIGGNGEVSFFTTNIFGEQEIFLEIEGLDADNGCHLEIVSPFVNVGPGAVAPLKLSSCLAGRLAARSVGMQVEKAFNADTLYEYIPDGRLQLLRTKPVRYVLDDYTRFPDMREVLSEIVQETRTGSGSDIRVRMQDSYNTVYMSSGMSMAMIDGIPVLDQSRILEYDPLLVQYIDVYPYSYLIGTRLFGGVLNFVTYKRNLPSCPFADNVRIVNFQGASVPRAYTCNGAGPEYPDYRQTIWWHPVINIPKGESYRVKIKRPAYEGRFDAVAEGLSADGTPVYATLGNL